MNWRTKLAIPLLVLGLAGVADAKGTKKHAHHATKMTIVSVSGNDVIVASHHKKKSSGQTTTLHTTAETVINIQGVSGKTVRDLTPGETVEVQQSNGVATKLTVAKKNHHKKKK